MADDESAEETADEGTSSEETGFAAAFRVLDLHAVELLTWHTEAQVAMLRRIAQLAEQADSEDLQRLADAYLRLPAPHEDLGRNRRLDSGDS